MPYRFDARGNVEVMLITSRSSGQHWIPPKGHPMIGREPHEAAAQEAYEEAGVIGAIAPQPLGAYEALKLGANGVAHQLSVTVFPLRVQRRAKDWPEKGQRTILWFDPVDAAKAVREPGLALLIAGFHPLSRP